MTGPRGGRKRDPFAPLKPLLAAVAAEPLRPVLFVLGDDGWIVGEAVKRLTAAFQKAFAEGEVAIYEGGEAAVREAVADASTLPLFASHRLVVLDANELLKTR